MNKSSLSIYYVVISNGLTAKTVNLDLSTFLNTLGYNSLEITNVDFFFKLTINSYTEPNVAWAYHPTYGSLGLII